MYCTGFGKYQQCLSVLSLSGNKSRMSAVCEWLLSVSLFSFLCLLYKRRTLVLVKGCAWNPLSRVQKWKEWGTQQPAPVLFTYTHYTFCNFVESKCEPVTCSMCCWGMCQVYYYSHTVYLQLMTFLSRSRPISGVTPISWSLIFRNPKRLNGQHETAASVMKHHSHPEYQEIKNSPHYSFRCSCFLIVKTGFFSFYQYSFLYEMGWV